MADTPFLMKAYGGISQLLYPAVSPMLASRERRGKEDALRIGERKGIASLARPDGVLVWMHGASVGEVISLLPVAEYIMASGAHVLMTSGTVTSAEVAARRLPKGAIHHYVPLDLPVYVERFLAHWKPDIGLFAESELWPNLIHTAHRRGTHLVLVNARMSERSFRRWKRLPSFITALLSRFELALAQTEADAERLRQLGAPRVQAIGNLKYDVLPPPADAGKLKALKALVAGRPVFIAASTHPGEEALIAEALKQAKALIPRLLTVLIPRHPERGEEVAKDIFRAGLSVCRRSEGAMPDAHTDVYVADTIGELGYFYRLGNLSYMGGSLVEKGGQNPIEPAKLGNAILHGPHVKNFTQVFDTITQAGGARIVSDSSALAAALVALLNNPSERKSMGAQAKRAVEAMAGANRRTTDALGPLLVQARIDSSARLERS
jgi:3-deoxy-D-manno-octulosonic-acid transferase